VNGRSCLLTNPRYLWPCFWLWNVTLPFAPTCSSMRKWITKLQRMRNIFTHMKRYVIPHLYDYHLYQIVVAKGIIINHIFKNRYTPTISYFTSILYLYIKKINQELNSCRLVVKAGEREWHGKLLNVVWANVIQLQT